ncbi:phospholipase D-like domain-containing protein [Mangrovibacterium marinum]|uniref:phospholipase D-like domain-containing protein n=1 Tax=Mangrovibacterium marinum TaxID=1639118 RepID=UPI002A18BE47|nr:phospholipase D-like domain-containing protein [Mangrovibacterium marinum]
MQTEAIFENIAEEIQQEITQASQAIFIAVAWFTNRNLFAALLDTAKQGVSVSLMISNDSINRNGTLDFEQLSRAGANVYFIGDGEAELMHNKFCVIDYNTVINGSYNWSYKAESNFENVIITHNDTLLAEQFVNEFGRIKRKYYQEETAGNVDFPLSNVIKRLEIVRNYIVLEDIEELKSVAEKLQAYSFNNEIQDIIEEIRRDEFASAVVLIERFISKNQQLMLWTDPEIIALKLEIKNLENQLGAYDNEKIELEKLLSDFQHRHTIELGEVILEILRLRKLKFQNDKAKYEEAANDEREYQEQVVTEQKKKVFELTPEQKKQLKKKFRKASVLCHPDKVAEELKDAAQQIFIDLKQAYDLNDLDKVAGILNELERGIYFKPKSESITEKELLKAAIARLRQQIEGLEHEIITIKQSETYQTVSSIQDWEEYFNRTKELLQKELDTLQYELIE